MMALSERKREILATTINHYIEKAEPVSSKLLIDHYSFDVSSATIRNDLNELEKDGYLTNIHTSSGRIPTDLGYRLYVDFLMKQKSLTPTQKQLFQRTIQTLSRDLTDVFMSISKLMSSLIDYSTMIVTPSIFQDTIKVVHLVMVDLDRVLVVLLHSAGVNDEFLLTLNDEFDQNVLNQISKLLTEKLEGKALSSLSDQDVKQLLLGLPHYKNLILTLLTKIKELQQHQKLRSPLLIDGTSKLLKLPEFQNIELTQRVLSSLEESKALLNLLAKKQKGVEVLIGSEHEVNDLESCSMVVSQVEKDGQAVGKIGILGPKRMAYSSVVPLVHHVSQQIESFINNEGV